MSSSDEGSVTIWIGHLKAGNHLGARLLWDRYFDRMVRLVRKRLQASNGFGADQDEEDVALSAFGSLWRSAKNFEHLNDRDDLWQILIMLTGRKLVDQHQKRTALKRGGGKVLTESSLVGADDRGVLDQLAKEMSDPEAAAIAAEEYQHLLDQLRDDSLRQIALWKMDGLTNEQIADRLNCSLRTVANKLKLIRMSWLKEAS